jgi:hypothetical protein
VKSIRTLRASIKNLLVVEKAKGKEKMGGLCEGRLENKRSDHGADE